MSWFNKSFFFYYGNWIRSYIVYFIRFWVFKCYGKFEVYIDIGFVLNVVNNIIIFFFIRRKYLLYIG